MLGEPRVLDDELLHELEVRLRRQGAFVASALRPGLSDEEMDSLTARLSVFGCHWRHGRWWGWHDGAAPQVPGVDAASEIGPDRAFLPLAKAVDQCQRIRDVMRYAWGEDLAPDWKRSWLPIDANKRPTVFDCGGAFKAPVPVRSLFTEDPSAGAQGVRSIGGWWRSGSRRSTRGAWSYNRDREHWEYDWNKLAPNIASLHLA